MIAAAAKAAVRARRRFATAAVALLALAAPAAAQTAAEQALPAAVVRALAAVPAGARIGMLVVDDHGREIIAIAPDQRFVPASLTKLATTAAALELIGDRPDSGSTVALLRPAGAGHELVLRGDAGVSLSTAADCTVRCLADIAHAAARRARRIDRIVADDSGFADQRWSPGMSWNNIGTDFGTAVSALVVDDNQIALAVSPGSVGQPPAITVSPYFTVINRAVTVPGGQAAITVERAPGSRDLFVAGTIGEGAGAWHETLGIDDPAHYAGWHLARLLAAGHGTTTPEVVTIHRRPGEPADTPPAVPAADVLAQVAPPPLADLVTVINKRSQNLHAEILLRRIGRLAIAGGVTAGSSLPPPAPGSREAGVAALDTVLARAGAPRAGYDLVDGSGLSTYNRLSPRATVALLRWAAQRPWGPAFVASLPVGAGDGTLRARFAGTALAGRIRAKTGSLNATAALAGYLHAASGQRLTFAIMANDLPPGTRGAPVIDALIAAVAAAN